ncbi:MAG: hypothetical protein VX609_02490 [Verrucomicrobiota bacterium]|nr:hypothetical protein [Verrucomicrobiota bacterium]
MRLLILSSKTGGGHEMRASAISDISSSLGIKTQVIRPLEEGSSIDKFGSNLYNWIQKFYPRLHKIYFHFLEIASLHHKSSMIFSVKNYEKKILEFSPDLVISVHAHLNHGFRDIICENIKLPNVPKFVVCCGELSNGSGFSNHWVNPKIDEFWCPFEDSLNAAVSRGMPFQKSFVVGPLLREPFYSIPSKKEIDDFILKYRLKKDLGICLLGTGANGVQNHIKAIRSLRQSSYKGQIFALCGNNGKLQSKLIEQNQYNSLIIRPVGRLCAKEMSVLMHLSSWIYGRPGAGLTTEALVANRSMVFDTNKGVMPQEENNLNFWRDNCQKLTIANGPRELGLLCKQTMPPFKTRKSFSTKLIAEKLLSLKNQIDAN